MKKENPTRGCCSFLCCCCVNPPQALIQVDVLNAHGLEKQDMTGAGKIFHNYNAYLCASLIGNCCPSD